MAKCAGVDYPTISHKATHEHTVLITFYNRGDTEQAYCTPEAAQRKTDVERYVSAKTNTPMGVTEIHYWSPFAETLAGNEQLIA